ncbi:MAG: hypothetical protein GC192_16055 [Bacteroidetes bacterium]|nr:hypothetical protein [Bacteroidota bacterium]
MKKLSHSITLLLLTLQLASAQSPEKILVSTINLNHQNTLVFATEGKVEIRQWNDPFVQVQASVFLENSNESVLKSLVQAGRYKLTSLLQPDGLVVEAPGLKKQVSIGGVVLQEKVSYIIYVPSNISVKLLDEPIAENQPQP